MELTIWKRRLIRLALILVLIATSGLTACGGGGGGGDGAGATVEQSEPAQEKSWDKLVWDKGTWG